MLVAIIAGLIQVSQATYSQADGWDCQDSNAQAVDLSNLDCVPVAPSTPMGDHMPMPSDSMSMPMPVPVASDSPAPSVDPILDIFMGGQTGASGPQTHAPDSALTPTDPTTPATPGPIYGVSTAAPSGQTQGPTINSAFAGSKWHLLLFAVVLV